MRPASSSCITYYYLVLTILIGISYEVPLSGKNVRDAKVDELPFVVSLEMRGDEGSNFCVGTLISRQSVLTAAHCLFRLKYDEVDIMVGSLDLRKGKRYQPKSWISYDQWMNTTDVLQLSGNDIAVITLNEPVIGCNAAPVLTFSRQDLDFSKVRIAGWGFSENGVKPTILKTAVLQVIPNDECESRLESVVDEIFEVSEKYFCTIVDPWVLGSCGDSGAPILNKQNQVVGIHRGVCPEFIRKYNYTEEFINQNMVNIHLHLLEYRKFISDVKI